MSEQDLTPIPDCYLLYQINRARKRAPQLAIDALEEAAQVLERRGELTQERKDLLAREARELHERIARQFQGKEN